MCNLIDKWFQLQAKDQEIVALKRRIAVLEKQVADLCPIGAFDALTTWQAEKQLYMENVAELERELAEEVPQS